MREKNGFMEPITITQITISGFEYLCSLYVADRIHLCRLNFLIILNQNLPIRDENNYDFGKILLS